jgi:dihydroorotate dehydrogenase
VKVSPDLSFDALDEILELAPSRGIAGIVATNTTTTRPETSDESARIYAETGGLSGKPLRARSTEIIRHIYQRTLGKLAIIGVGGLFNAEDAWEKIAAGASLLQIYTGLVYEGPSIVSDIVRGLLARMEAEGIANIHQATGSAHKIRLKDLGS